MLKGLAVSDGIGIGTAVVFQEEDIQVVRYQVTDWEAEERRFLDAIGEFVSQLAHVHQVVSRNLGSSEADIFVAQSAIVQDPELAVEVQRQIRQESVNAEHAFSAVCDRYIDLFAPLADDRVSARAADFRDIKERMLCILMNIPHLDLTEVPDGSILVARNIPPSRVSTMDVTRIRGILTQEGTRFSHIAILAKALQLPAIMGVEGLLDRVADGDTVVLDGYQGVAWVSPTKDDLAYYSHRVEVAEQIRRQRALYQDQPTCTADGHTIHLGANLAMPHELKVIRRCNADGIGLFRTEYLYMDHKLPPTEGQQYAIYRQVVKAMEGKPVVIRTLDAGGDKNVPYLSDHTREENPVMGYRAVRMCLGNPELFREQLAAILQAASLGDVRILVPMITSLTQLRQVRQLIRETETQLAQRGADFVKNIPVGIMVETPAAAICAAELAKEADFFSIGTNDLTQYLLAVDRGNAKVAALYQHLHPAVLRTVAHIVAVADKAGISVSVCGEAAADALALAFFIGLGVTQFSVGAGLLLDVRSHICSLTYRDWKEEIPHILAMESAEQVTEFISSKLGI